MSRARIVPVLAVLLALPGMELAVAGLLHPHHLTSDTAQRWTQLHLVGLFVFPLVGMALATLVPGAWLVHTDHIFAPSGAFGVLLIGVGTGLVAAFATVGRPDVEPSAM